jgi:hypothetical protein
LGKIGHGLVSNENKPDSVDRWWITGTTGLMKAIQSHRLPHDSLLRYGKQERPVRAGSERLPHRRCRLPHRGCLRNNG